MTAGGMGEPRRPAPRLRQVAGDAVDVLEVSLPGRAARYCAAACPHRGGRLMHGRLDAARGRLACPLHQSTFDLATGAVLSGAADSPLWVGTCPPVDGEGPAT